MKLITLILAISVVAFSSAAIAQEDSTSTATNPAETVQENTTVKKDNVRRAHFTTSVVDREPVDELAAIPPDAATICFFTELVNLAGETVTHRWLHNGEPVAEVTIEIGGPRWRAYSQKTLPAVNTGSWAVEIVDSYGDTVHRAELAIGERPKEPVASE
jgi:hypothetical protein